ncbi:MAG: tetratricopeptide repeat protein [candidate division KSB1 bacterium]|nr:tetratricopeptide repeat protein [candidate division KSB1 bacterium]MDZ7303466.1 tetratricopeptide repeat protein [candidate division KSB1 bacterium]MDZ7312548.1 tetratricopeptide repeat protein [candidate division KSB1 bacterium]
MRRIILQIQLLGVLLILCGFSTLCAASDSDIAQGIRLFQARKFDEAKNFFSDFIKTHPQDARAAYYLGRVSLVDNDFDAAIEWFERALEIEKDSALCHLWLGRAYGRKAMSANIIKKASLAKKVLAEFEQAVRLAPDNLEARFALLQYYIMAPGIMGGSKGKAREQAQEIKTYNLLQGHIAFGMIYESEKQYDQAQAEYQNAIAAFPDSIQAYDALALLFQRREQYDEAIALTNDVIARFPDKRKDSYLRLGQLHVQMKQYDKALASFDQALALDREYWNGYYQIGRLGALSGQYLDRAEQGLKIFIENAPKGDNFPSLAWAHVRLGMIYEHRGNKELAAAEFHQALKLDPKHEEAKKALKRVKQ